MASSHRCPARAPILIRPSLRARAGFLWRGASVTARDVLHELAEGATAHALATPGTRRGAIFGFGGASGAGGGAPKQQSGSGQPQQVQAATGPRFVSG